MRREFSSAQSSPVQSQKNGVYLQRQIYHPHQPPSLTFTKRAPAGGAAEVMRGNASAPACVALAPPREGTRRRLAAGEEATLAHEGQRWKPAARSRSSTAAHGRPPTGSLVLVPGCAISQRTISSARRSSCPSSPPLSWPLFSISVCPTMALFGW